MTFPWHVTPLRSSGKLSLPWMPHFCVGGLTISTKKTKVLVVGRNAAAQTADSVITLRGDPLEVVSHFKYLGSVFTSNCTLDAVITHGVAAANSAVQQLRRANIWSSRALTLSVKMQFFQCIGMSVLLYYGKTWAVVKQHISPLAVFPDELLATHLWHILAQSCAKCCHTT